MSKAGNATRKLDPEAQNALGRGKAMALVQHLRETGNVPQFVRSCVETAGVSADQIDGVQVGFFTAIATEILKAA